MIAMVVVIVVMVVVAVVVMVVVVVVVVGREQLFGEGGNSTSLSRAISPDRLDRGVQGRGRERERERERGREAGGEQESAEGIRARAK